MPTYGPLRTAVSLYMWEADARQDISGLGDSSSGCEVERIREDAFDNTGLDFLGPGSVPFYLVNAGQDLFSPTAPVDNDDAITPATKVRPVNSTTAPALAESACPVTRSPLPSPPTNESIESDHDSSLSTLSSSMFETSPQGAVDGTGNNADTSANAVADADNTASEPKKKPSKTRRPFKPPVLVQKAIHKPITSPKAIKLQIDLSRESFMHSLITNTPGDICISVFYNGEFVYSRVFSWNTFNSGQKSECGHPTMSGRRVGTTIEVPWIIMPMYHDVPTDFVSRTMSNAEARWNKINQNLLAEADEWGRDGKFDMFRNPLGEYLEALSKTSIPKKAWPLSESGPNIGVIDVVVGLGKSIIHPYRSLLEPQRKLTEGLCGLDNKLFIVPKELSQTNLSQIIASFQSEEYERKDTRARKAGTRPKVTVSRTTIPEQSNNGTMSAEVARKRGSRATSISSSATGNDFAGVGNASESIPAGSHDGLIERDQPSNQSLAMNVPPRVAPLKKSTLAKISEAAKISEPPIHAIPPPPPKSKLPKNIPQKRYRGPTPPPAEVEAVTPDVYIEPPSHSTRSRTSAASSGSPLVVSPPATTPRNSQEPVDSIREPPPHRQRAKSQRVTGSTTPLPKSSPFGLDGFEDDCYEIRSGSMIFPGSLGSPLRQLPSTETNQFYRGPDFGFDGTGDEPKTTKRKRASLEASPGGVPKAKVSRNRAKSRNVSGSSTQSQPAPTGSIAASSSMVPQVTIRSASQAPSDGPKNPEQQTGTVAVARKPRQRNLLSARELDSLLEPHKPTANADTSFGHSFAERSNSSRSTRNSTTRQQIRAQLTSSTPPRITARIENGRIFIIKGLRVDEMLKDKEKVQSAEKAATHSELLETSKAVQNVEDFQVAATERILTSSSAGRVLRSTKTLDANVFSIECSSAVQNDDLKFQKSAQFLPAQANVEAEQKICKDTFTSDFKELTEVVDSAPAQKYINGDFLNPEISITSMSSPKVMTSLANKKENVRPSSTTSSGAGFTHPEQKAFKIPEKVLEVAKGNANLETTATLSVKGLNGQGRAAGLSFTENLEKVVPAAAQRAQQYPPESAGGQTGHSQNHRKDTIAVPEASISTETQFPLKAQKTSAKQPPVMKFKIKTSTDTPTEPQTPSNRQSKAKSGLTIQPGLANAYRSYSETSTGLKTPTPRSGTFPTTQAPEPPRTRAATRAMQDTPDVSAIAMPPMVNFTPQKNREQNRTPSNRRFAEMSSSPALPSPAPLTKETRILPPKRLLYESPSSTRVLRSVKQAPTPIALDLTKTVDNLTTPNVLTTKSAAPQPLVASSMAGSSPGKKATPEPKTLRQRQLRDETSRSWTPTSLCQDSVLSYVDENNSAGLSGLKYDRISENICRATKSEREGVFRTSGILMGVRYVMGLGSESAKKY